MLDKTQLYQLAGRGEQQRNVEFKRSMPWDTPNTKAKITKAILALSNIRDGGYLILGFNQNNDVFEPSGMMNTDLASYNYDDVKSYVSEYADPYVEFSMEIVRDDANNRAFLVFTVHEFEEIPTICKKDGDKLEKGAVYTRSRRMPESVKIPTQSEMREIIEMAAEKGIRKYIETSRRAGLVIGTSSQVDEYDKELESIP